MLLIILISLIIVCESLRWQQSFSINRQHSNSHSSLTKLFGRPKKIVDPSLNEEPQAEEPQAEKPKRGRYFLLYNIFVFIY